MDLLVNPSPAPRPGSAKARAKPATAGPSRSAATLAAVRPWRGKASQIPPALVETHGDADRSHQDRHCGQHEALTRPGEQQHLAHCNRYGCCRVRRHGITSSFAPIGIREAVQFESLFEIYEALQRRELEGLEGTVPCAVLAANDGHQAVLARRAPRVGPPTHSQTKPLIAPAQITPPCLPQRYPQSRRISLLKMGLDEEPRAFQQVAISAWTDAIWPSASRSAAVSRAATKAGSQQKTRLRTPSCTARTRQT
jgi:hypothetical protein